ncbi:MAG TPA: O-antigen ligase family protein, partial [Bdellovibrio sp.]|nr:O-antigen ligase family protein [Bdellovibrio sp.]
LRKGRAILFFILGWLLCNVIGYITSSPMGSEQWEEIFGFRWLIGFLACIYAGRHISIISNFQVGKASIFFLSVLIMGLIWQIYHPTNLNIYGGIERLHGFYHNPNNFALAMVIPWTFLLGWLTESFLSTNKLPRLISICFLTLTVVLYATFTRSAWVGMFASIVAVIVITKNRKLYFSFFSTAVFFALLFVFNIFSFKERLMYSFDIQKGNSSALRLLIWKVNWNIFLDHPFFGVGFWENIRLVPAYYKKLGIENETILIHAHNQFLQILVGSGIIGFSFYCATFIFGIFCFLRKYRTVQNESQRKIALAGALVLIGFLFSGLFESPLMFHEPRTFLLLFAGLTAGYVSETKS